VALTDFDAGEIGVRGTISPDSKDAQVSRIEVRIDARDLVFVQDRDHYNGELRLALVGYLNDGRAERTKVIPFDLHYSTEEHEKALNDGIIVSRTLPIAGRSKVRVIVYDRNSTAIGSLTLPVH